MSPRQAKQPEAQAGEITYSDEGRQVEPTSFAERVQREPGDEPEARRYPKAFGVRHDNEAGVELSMYTDKEKKIYEVHLKFRDGKPSEEVRRHMKENGFRWQPAVPQGGHFNVAGAWVHPIGYKTQSQDRLQGDRVYQKVVDMIREEKGIERAPDSGQTPF